PLTASTSPGKGERAERRTSAMSVKAIGWRRSRFTRTILGMRVRDATVARLLACCLAAAALACREARRANPRPADAGTMVTVYVPPKAADRIAGRLQTIAAQHQWALSIRTDSAALADADLAIADSAGTLVSRVRAGSPAAAQARQMADAVLPSPPKGSPRFRTWCSGPWRAGPRRTGTALRPGSGPRRQSSATSPSRPTGAVGRLRTGGPSAP